MNNKVISKEYVEKNYISIKELKKVLDIEEYDNVDILSLISTLMSEVDRLEDIEDRKVQIECQLMFDKGVKSVEDKIIKKIEELKEYIYETEKKTCGRCITIGEDKAIQILREILGD